MTAPHALPVRTASIAVLQEKPDPVPARRPAPTSFSIVPPERRGRRSFIASMVIAAVLIVLDFALLGLVLGGVL